MSDLILAVTVTCTASSTAAAIAGAPMRGDGLVATVTEGSWLIVDMGGGIFAQVPVAADAIVDNALTLLHPLPGAVAGAAGWVAADPDKDSIAVATMQAVQTLRARLSPASVWYSGNGTPSTDLGIDGDFYRDYNELPPIEWRKVAGAWALSPTASVLPWVPRGDWDSGTTYGESNLVAHNGSSWLSRVADNLNHEPISGSALWQLVARAGDQILFGSGVPAIGLGVDGAAYVNTANGDLYKKVAGTWGVPVGSFKGPKGDQGDQGIQGVKGDQGIQGLKGDQGIQGLKGDQGIQGIKGDQGIQGLKGDQGIQGLKGDQGDQGVSGGQWFEGAGDPAVEIGADNDLYLQTGTGTTGVKGDVWRKVAGAWAKVGNIRGASGAGTGDMQAATYDPGGRATDVFNRANHVGTQAIASVDGLQSALNDKADSADLAAVATSGAKADVGLGNVDNTSDVNKPVSSATQTALNAKANAASLGTAATHPATDFATAAQGAKADTAVQPGSLGTAATHPATDFATAAQGAKADTAVQPAALGTAAALNTGTANGNVPVLGAGGKLDPAVIPGGSSLSIPRRHTVLSGPVTSAGLPNFWPATSASLTLTMQNVPASNLVAAIAKGFGASGAVDAVVVVNTNLAITLPASSLNYVLLDGTGALVSTTVPIIEQSGGTISVTNGQHTYDKRAGQMYLGNGTVANPVDRVLIGEVTTGASTVTQTVAYAYQGYFDSGWTNTLPAPGTLTSFNSNIGSDDQEVFVIYKWLTAAQGWLVGDIYQNPGTVPASGIVSPTPTGATRNAAWLLTGGQNSFYALNKTTGAGASATVANLAYRLIARRRY